MLADVELNPPRQNGALWYSSANLPNPYHKACVQIVHEARNMRHFPAIEDAKDVPGDLGNRSTTPRNRTVYDALYDHPTTCTLSRQTAREQEGAERLKRKQAAAAYKPTIRAAPSSALPAISPRLYPQPNKTDPKEEIAMWEAQLDSLTKEYYSRHPPLGTRVSPVKSQKPVS